MRGISKFVGAIIVLIGLAILVAGAFVIFKPRASAESWAYRELTEEAPWIATFTENPHADDIMATIGSYVVGVHHSIGVWDVAEANSMNDAESTAQTAGLVTAGFGVFLLIVGGLVASAGEKKIQVISRTSKE